MKANLISEKSQVEFNKKSGHPLQSWEWGEFRKAWGNEVVRFPFGQVIFSKVPFTNFCVGTFIKGPKPNKELLETLKKIGKEKNALFIKIEPNYVADDKEKADLVNLLRSEGCVPGKTLFTPTTFWIDLTPSEEEIFGGFNPKTRYNIRYAQKKGVTVGEDNSDKTFKKYLDLTRETVERQGFYAHTQKYHKLMWEYLYQRPVANSEKPIARLLTARYKSEIITTWIVFVWHNFLYYPYGASTEKYKNVMANNLMMWEAIRYGKAQGLKTFDLWGREEGKGFTKFKEGYKPKVVEFLGSWDLVTSRFYNPYKFAEYIRWNVLRAKTKFSKPSF